MDLFRFIDEDLNWKYCIRCTKDLGITIPGKPKINKLQDIITLKRKVKHFSNIEVTAQKYVCNMAVCKEADDTWFIANNISEKFAIIEYKKRFDIEEMFKDFKGGGFNIEQVLNGLNYLIIHVERNIS